MTDDIKLKAIAKSWTRKYTKREVEIMLASNKACTPLEKDKLQYYFNCYNENDEVVHPYSCGEERSLISTGISFWTNQEAIFAQRSVMVVKKVINIIVKTVLKEKQNSV